nr:hypothetical protein [uncultured Pseudomonas sp.]
MKWTILALAPIIVTQLYIPHSRADELSAIRVAAEKGECVVVHEGRQEPAIALTASSYDLPGSDKREVLKLIDEFRAHDCSIEQPDSEGVSPINVAVLTAEPELLRYLLEAGGDPSVRITGSRPWANGKNSIEFAQLLYKVEPTEKRRQVIEILVSN